MQQIFLYGIKDELPVLLSFGGICPLQFQILYQWRDNPVSTDHHHQCTLFLSVRQMTAATNRWDIHDLYHYLRSRQDQRK